MWPPPPLLPPNGWWPALCWLVRCLPQLFPFPPLCFWCRCSCGYWPLLRCSNCSGPSTSLLLVPRKLTISRFTPNVHSLILSSMNLINNPIIISFSRTPAGDKCSTRIFLKSLTISDGNLLCTKPAIELKCIYLVIPCSSHRMTVASSQSLALMSHSLFAVSEPLQSIHDFTSSSRARSNSTGLPK